MYVFLLLLSLLFFFNPSFSAAILLAYESWGILFSFLFFSFLFFSFLFFSFG